MCAVVHTSLVMGHKAAPTSLLNCAGRIRKKGEMNGKSGNMNNVLAQIYPTGCYIPGNELIAVFDADQIAKPDFFLRTVSLFDAGDDVGMVSSHHRKNFV